ncbi:riboflavin synthase [Wolbachia endosymbiont of Diaphorina citri]|jgi:riboflavin synthase, alpha subunit|uniref:riboflavin synthase n=1 Tax=unclassified Wolbachia TaxID=2640676 RepID=UPI000380C160|nr:MULTISPECIES: riboflavin synthase [unclassified Wolbachia]AZU37684.1 riboflavin synthase subunit alpha [Wolbachia endosymbiont of Bemisia tabaci]QJT94193.1 riboflavin synthase [Wolbachia endosymbiont of Diaphorina citri]QJT95434.1 riboflavin synthase [Wolbachia endosymbiont of Diaphorina citri]QJT96795.1 riboflavin synthase [Wolbachia endosymbiont of Diaphorina citri]QLK11090.1 riboflavin synthase [Wolbachia endosymbiont of Diaphorina citri]
MFKGIIKDIGTITDITIHPNSDQIFHIETQNLSSINKGDSIACSGVCLTVVDIMNDVFIVQVSQETMKVSNLNMWKIGKKINLEQAMKLSDRIDGHLVQGHVDDTAEILTINQNSESHEIRLSCSQELIKFVAKKGSVTLDGVSLTVNSVVDQEFTVNIIPYTWKNTTFQHNKTGNYLNLEVDMIARYLDQLIKYQHN